MAAPPGYMDSGGWCVVGKRGKRLVSSERRPQSDGDIGTSTECHFPDPHVAPSCVAAVVSVCRGRVRFSKDLEEVYHIVGSHWVFAKQVIPHSRRHASYGVNMENFRIQSCRSHAEARRRAIELAAGGGRIDDVCDLGDWEGVAQVGENDVRRLLLIREGSDALMLADYTDGFVSYGWTLDKCPRIVATRVSLDKLCSSLKKRGRQLSDFVHVGESFDELLPVAAPCNPVRIASP